MKPSYLLAITLTTLSGCVSSAVDTSRVYCVEREPKAQALAAQLVIAGGPPPLLAAGRNLLAVGAAYCLSAK